MKNKPRLLLAIITIIASFCFFGKNNAYADKQYLNLSYHKVRYEQENGNGTTIWYAIIPAKYKMHYAYGNDRVWSGEKPSENAVRHNATIAVNSQILGFPIIDGVTHYEHDSVAGYDFSIEQNPNSVTDYDLFNVYANSPTDPRNGMSFYGVNIGFSYNGNGVDYNGNTIYMALFSQIVQDGTAVDFDNIPSTAASYGSARHPRTWLAYDSQGNQFVAVSAGRDADGPQAGLTFREIYNATRTYFTTDIYTLYNLDGGGSSGFIYKGAKISPNYDDNYTTERKINGIFYWKVETQQVSFDETSVTKTYGDANFTNIATTTGDGAITYSSSDANIASVNKNTGVVTIKKAGEVTITATAAATDSYNSASASYTLTINKRTATVSFKNNTITKTFGDANFTNAATTTGDGAITYSSSDPSVAEVNSKTGEVTIKAAGKVTITAYAAATTNCTAASTSYTLTINKADRTISFADSDITKTFGDANFTNAATANGDGAITYSSSDANIASVNKNTGVVTIKKAGEVTITANVAATNNYNSASTSYTLTINKADGTISFAENSITKTYGDANFTNAATANGDGAITYSSSDSTIAEVNSQTGEVTIKKAGEVTITASVAATNNYTSASASYTLTINEHTAIISFENTHVTRTYGDANFTNIATTTSDGAITYSSSDNSIAEVNSETGEVTIKAAGEVTITATTTTGNYESASASYVLTINKAGRTISFADSNITRTFGDANFINIATTTGDGTITYESNNTNVATVDGNTGEVTITGAGDAIITAHASATDYYLAAEASYTLTINKADRTISFAENSITKTFGDANFTNAATTNGDGTITYESSNTNIASVNKNTGVVTIKKAGQVTITATAAATDSYNSASASYTLTINKRAATISFANNTITRTFGDANFINIATTTGDGTITYTSSDTNIAEVNSQTGEVAIKKAGEVTITANVAATNNYTSASASYTLTINKHTAIISFENTHVTRTFGDANFINIATTTGDGAITYSSSDTSIAEVNSQTGEVTIKAAGEVTITATAETTENYTSASTSYTLTINKHTSTISFANNTITKTYGDANFTNIATTTGDGTISYSSSDSTIAEVNSQTGEVTIKKAGEVTITATVAATNYDSASASYTLTIHKKASQAPTEVSELKNGYVTDQLSSISFSTLGLTWVNPEEKIEEGSHFYPVNYTEHNDTSNYTTEQYEVTVLGKRRKYIVIEGDKQTFAIMEDGTVSFKINADYELFGDNGEIYVDDILVDRKNYDAESGSTIIKFHYDFVRTLALGEHTFTAIFNDGGVATASFALATEDPVLVPDTGNNTSTGLELKPAHAVVTMAVATFVYLYRKKIQRQKEHVKYD